MDQPDDALQTFMLNIKRYIKNRVDYIKLVTAEKSSIIVSNIAIAAVFVIIGSFIIFFLSIALALIISEAIGNLYSGFLIIGAFFTLVLLILWLGKERIIRLPVLKATLYHLFSKEQIEEENE